MAITRQINGTQDHHERQGASLYRDTRTGSVRLAELLRGPASSVLVGTAAVCCAMLPATIDFLTPLASGYATWALTRHPQGAIRLPKSARVRDLGDPDPKTRKPRQAGGIFFLGWDALTSQEIWFTDEDAREHFLMPGATGAGKTTAILSYLTNVLAQGSGFVLVDGKADNDLYARVLALARKFGRDDDVLVINFLVASGDKRTHRFNPFAWCNADMLRELLASQIESNPQGGDGNKIFMQRAIAFLGALAPVLVWVRDHKGVPIDIDKIRFATELLNVVTLVTKKRFRVLDIALGKVSDIDVNDIGEDLLYPLRAYLNETGNYDTTLDYQKQRTDEPFKQHSFVVMHFSATFTQLAVSLGHIFKWETGDIDMRDVVLNRRILVVNLPSLEGSSETTHALGKLVIASLRNMMAQTLGASLEGEYSKIVSNRPSTAETSYAIIMDEGGYYVPQDADKMFAQGRGLGFIFGLGFQEVGSFYKSLTEAGATPILGNPALKVILRLEDGGFTKKWVENAGGESDVTQVSGFNIVEGDLYTDARHADVRRVSRVSWLDVNRLLKGEAIVLYGGRRLYVRLFYAEIRPQGMMRVSRTLIVRPERPEARAQRQAAIDRVREKLDAGLDLVDEQTEDEPFCPILDVAFTAYGDALSAGTPPLEAAGLAIEAVNMVQDTLPVSDPAPEPGAADEATEAADQVAEAGSADIRPVDWHPFVGMLSPREPPSRNKTRPGASGAPRPELRDLQQAARELEEAWRLKRADGQHSASIDSEARFAAKRFTSEIEPGLSAELPPLPIGQWTSILREVAAEIALIPA